MQYLADSPDHYVAQLPEDRKAAIQQLRKVIKANLPAGFEETMSYGMIGYVVPHTLYPSGYHCKPELPLPFINIASQKNFIAIYHMGIYADTQLMNWFVGEYAKLSKTKLDTGKSCIRFKKPNEIPFELIGQLAGKMTPKAWITLYESQFTNKKK